MHVLHLFLNTKKEEDGEHLLLTLSNRHKSCHDRPQQHKVIFHTPLTSQMLHWRDKVSV